MADVKEGRCKMDGIPQEGQGCFPKQAPPELPKKYRLRPINFNNGNDIYKKYFQAGAATWISWFQIMLGFATFATEVMEMLIGDNVSWTNGFHIGGTWGIVSLAAGVSIAAAFRPSYCRLHSAMVLQILNVVVQYFLVEQIFGIDIPKIRRELDEESKSDAVIGGGGGEENPWTDECMRSGGNCTLAGQLGALEKKDIVHLYAFYRIELTLVGMGLIYGVLQLVLSLVMALMTGRAICCGRMSLERKFYEIESLGVESENPPRGRQQPAEHRRPFSARGDTHHVESGRKEMMLHQVVQRKESENSDNSITISPCQSPTPFSVSVTPRSSEDVDGNPMAEADGHDDTKPFVLQSPPAYTEK